jgi:hypothetical protein
MKEHLFTLQSDDGRHTFRWTQEPPRQRSVLNKGRVVRIRTEWIQYMRYDGPLHPGYLGKLWLYTSAEPVRTPDDPLMMLVMPHTAGSFCMGSGTNYINSMTPEDIFWMSDFVDGTVAVEPESIALTQAVYQYPMLPYGHPSYKTQRGPPITSTPRSLITSFQDSEHYHAIMTAWMVSERYKRIHEKEASRQREIFLALQRRR